MKHRKRNKCIFAVIFGFLILMIVLFYYNHQNKSFLKHSDIKNEVFTDKFFEGLIQVQSTTNSSNIYKWNDLKKMCNILANLSLKESDFKSNLDYYGGYSYILKYEHGKEEKLSFMGISEKRTLIYVDHDCYETEETLLPQIVELFEKTA